MARHWAEKYIGWKHHREFGCFWFVERVLRQQFGMWIKLYPMHFVDFAIQTDTPNEGDAVLMRQFGRVWSYGSHIGIHTTNKGLNWVLHSVEGHGSMFMPESKLLKFGYEIAGYYRWR